MYDTATARVLDRLHYQYLDFKKTFDKRAQIKENRKSEGRGGVKENFFEYMEDFIYEHKLVYKLKANIRYGNK